jgi:hypothetical protein
VVSGIFIAPTISIDKVEVKRGDVLTILGQSAPSATVSIVVGSDQEIMKKTNADGNGIWIYKFDTSEIEYGDHGVRAKAAKDEDISTFSDRLAFKVSTKNVSAAPVKKCATRGDVNNDCRVNLVDFSIMAYWYHRPLSDAARISVDQNSDGKIDLVDFSIMAYYWTG